MTIDKVTGPGHCPRKQDSGLRIGHWHGTLLALVTHDQSQVQDWRQYHNVIFMFWLAYLATAKISQVTDLVSLLSNRQESNIRIIVITQLSK